MLILQPFAQMQSVRLTPFDVNGILLYLNTRWGHFGRTDKMDCVHTVPH